mmetsp:Transcript_22589/g.68896  ORF Transcript_22589/g.68896 Transcript_22589/m.68896 type:complete len:240 (+) Transcript_22589:1508-2227(+)|eukprot:scaffold80496_cov29-Tisochrysis_lutea.AAC.2
MALSVRPGNRLTISDHLLPSSATPSAIKRSSSSVHSPFVTAGHRWFAHRSRHCFPMRPGMLEAITDQRCGPNFSTSARSCSSSSLVHQEDGLRFTPAFRALSSSPALDVLASPASDVLATPDARVLFSPDLGALASIGLMAQVSEEWLAPACDTPLGAPSLEVGESAEDWLLELVESEGGPLCGRCREALGWISAEAAVPDWSWAGASDAASAGIFASSAAPPAGSGPWLALEPHASGC